MRIATHALQHKQRLLEGARRRLTGLPVAHVDASVETLFRAVVSRLGDAPTSPVTLTRLAARLPSSSLEAITRTIGAAVVEDLPWSAAARKTLPRAMERALADVLAVVAPQAVRALDDDALASPLLDIFVPPTEPGLPPAFSQQARALLRLRATTPEAAEALSRASETVLLPPELGRVPSSPDELLLSAPGALDEAVLALVRAAQSVSRALGTDLLGEVSGGLVELPPHDDSELTQKRALAHAAVLASALATPGRLALDEGSWRACSFSLAELPGREHSVDPAAPFRNDRWELSALLVRPQPVGREEEVEALRALLSPPNGSTSARLAVLHGPPGIGRTTLLRLALRAEGLADEEAPLLWGAADALFSTPFAPYVGMLRALAGAPAGHPRARARLLSLVDGLSDALPESGRRELISLLPVLAYLIGAVDEGASSDPEVESLSPRALQAAIRRSALLLVEALCARAGGRRPIIVITGADSIDAPTQDLLAFLGRRLGQRLTVVLVVQGRLRLRKSLYDRFTVGRHEVSPLSPDAAQALLERVLDQPLTEEAVAPLVDRARGSPLTLLQLVRFAVEGGFVTRSDGQWELSSLNARDLPGRVERALERRVRHLPDDARRVLGAAAPLGLSFLPAMVEHVAAGLGVEGARARRGLVLLLETGFLVQSRRSAHPTAREDDEGETTLSFSHPVLRPVAAEVLDEGEQRRAQLLAAEALERFLTAGSHAVAAQLARHLRLGGESAAAVRPLTIAVRRAVRLDDRAGALSLAREGLTLLDEEDLGARFDLQLEVERVLERGGDLANHAAALRGLVQLGERGDDPRRQAQALFRLARFHLLRGDADEAERAAAQALELARSGEDLRGQVQALRLLGLARLERRELASAEDALAYARFLAAPDDARTLARLDHQRGILRLEAGDPVGALEHLVSAVAQSRSFEDLGGEAAALDAVAEAYSRTGRPDRARDILLRAVELHDQLGDEAGRAQSTLHLGETALTLGDIEVADQLATAARDLSRASSLERLERSAALLAARTALARDDAYSAESLIESVRRRVDEKADAFCAMEAALLSARAKQRRALASSGAARDRLLRTALRRAQEATDLGTARGWLTGRALGAAVYAEVLAEMGDGSGALPYSLRALELVDGQGRTLLPSEEVLGAHARACEAAGDLDGARQTLERAISLVKARASRLPEELQGRYLALSSRAGLFDALLRIEEQRV